MSGYDKVDAAIQRGDIWRAKEILRGRVGNTSYEAQLFERYGRLLLHTADTFEAGKFLFLSGVRKHDYKQAIELFLERHKRKQPNRIWTALPAHIRHAEVGQWPKSVIEELALLGVHIEELQRTRQSNVAPSTGNKLGTFLAILIAASILIGFVVGVGIKSILEWLF